MDQTVRNRAGRYYDWVMTVYSECRYECMNDKVWVSTLVAIAPAIFGYWLKINSVNMIMFCHRWSSLVLHRDGWFNGWQK